MAQYDHPGLYLNIVQPQVPSINGVSANKGGIVGSASFGPVNSPVNFANYANGAAIFGTPNPRKYDLMTAVAVAQLQGSNISFTGSRVTDGTDTAASGSIGNNGTTPFWTALAAGINSGSNVNRGPSNFVVVTPTSTGLTAAAKYTGSYGNGIVMALTGGSAANSYRVTVTAPGVQPEVFDSLGAAQAAAAPATGTITFSAQPANTSTITFNGTAVEFVTSGATGLQVNIGTTLAVTLARLLNLLQGSSDSELVQFQYTLAGSALGLSASVAGTAGNSLTVAASTSPASNATVSHSTLQNGAAAITPPTIPQSFTLAGGTDGAGAITKAILLGSDTYPRTGMYALRSTGVSAIILADLDDVTSFSTQDAFSGSEGTSSANGQAVGPFMGCVTPAGDTISNAIANKTTYAIDTPNIKYLLGDWITYNDNVNNLQRLVSPQGFWLGVRCNLSPAESTLNKVVYGIVSTQTSAANQQYAAPDLASLYAAGIDVIANPSAGSQNYFSTQNGRNASSNAAIRGENYTMMTNFIARLLKRSCGVFVGQLQSLRSDDTTRRKANAHINSIMGRLADRTIQNPPLIDDYQTILNSSDNTQLTISQGFMFAYVKAVYMSVVEFFGINFEGGQTVTITRSGVTTVDQSSSSSAANTNAPFLA